jgi:hypothetical protein
MAQVSYEFWGQFEDDDITKLHEDYEAKVTDDNRVYFVKYVWSSTLMVHTDSPPPPPLLIP